jgi:hypothetical protein
MMAKSATVTFLGDQDPNVQSVEMFGRTYVKGEPVTLKEGEPGFDKVVNNPTFSTEKGAEPVAADEPAEAERPEPEEGTELQALRRQLDGHGVTYSKTAGVDALRKKLADSVG